MNAFAATTDPYWFEFLAGLDDVDEVNFWMPHAWGPTFGVLRRGDPLLFKLRAPSNAIAGGGFFEHYTELPLPTAWEAFGMKNGAATLAELESRARRHRRSDRDDGDVVVGCIVLVEPFFWPRDRWIEEPPGWHPQIGRGRTYDLREGEGRILWEEVVTRLQAGGVWGGRVEEGTQLEIPGGYGDPLLRPHRIGPGTFRTVVTDAYGRRCAVTGERALPALEAANIRPFRESPVHYIRNGILLRADVRKLLDAGYLTVTPKYRVKVSTAVETDFGGESPAYRRLHGTRVSVPERIDWCPDPDILRWHNETVFRG